jgi:hypothetical protein
MHLTVKDPFEKFDRGSKIYDQETIDKVLKGENVRHVIKTHGDAPKAEEKPLEDKPEDKPAEKPIEKLFAQEKPAI